MLILCLGDYNSKVCLVNDLEIRILIIGMFFERVLFIDMIQVNPKGLDAVLN